MSSPLIQKLVSVCRHNHCNALVSCTPTLNVRLDIDIINSIVEHSHLNCGDLLKYAGVEGHVQVEGDAIQPLQAEYQLIKQKLGFLRREWGVKTLAMQIQLISKLTL